MPDPYSTHIRVLDEVVKRLKPQVVVEYGGGDYSTPFFLGFPCVEQLITVEPDEEWRERILRRYACPRLWLVHSLKLAGAADLILIDNGTAAPERVEVINEVLSRPHPTVVIHDAEVPAYEQAIRESGRTFRVDKKLKPHTAIVNPCAS
jgi:hypothetical protein